MSKSAEYSPTIFSTVASVDGGGGFAIEQALHAALVKRNSCFFQVVYQIYVRRAATETY